MSDPIKVPDQADSGNVRDKGASESKRGPAIGHGKAYPWGWIAGIIVLLLMLWGFFGMDHEKPVIHPAVPPASAASTIE